MSARLFGRIGLLGALAATFLGGFAFAQASVDVALTIDGVETEIFSPGGDADYAFTITVSDDTASEVIIFIEDEEGELMSGIADTSCGSADENFSGTDIVECFWTTPFTGSELIEFRLAIDEEGEYLIVVSTFLDGVDDYVDVEIEIEAGEPETPFTLSSAIAYDTDANGYLDTFKVRFSNAIDPLSIDENEVEVAGYEIESVSVWEGESSSLAIVVEENDSPDTGDTPEITISSLASTEGTELSGDNSQIPDDQAGPVLVSGQLSEDGSTITLTLSEDINGTTINGTGTDFTLSTGSIDNADETGAGVVALVLTEALEVSELDVTLLEDSIEDLVGIQNGDAKTITIERVEDSTPITIESVGLTTSGTSTEEVLEGDMITLTFLLAEIASSVEVDILDESDVAVATNGVTYTATYTVDADTPTGTVTFSIAVSDEAGNESTAEATTDGSELTVVRGEEEGDVGGGGDDDLIEFSISLTSANNGLNLISLPVSPESTDIEDVLGDILDSVETVWTYIDGAWLVYRPGNPTFSTLTTMDAGYGYWIEVSEDATLTGEGEIQTSIRTLTTGWQLIGYLQPDIDTDGSVSIDEAFFSVGLAGLAYSDLLLFNTETGELESAVSVEPGNGFWMQVTDAEVSLSPA